MATKKQLRKLSQNTIEELICLSADMSERIDTYGHVSEHLPRGLAEKIATFRKNCIDELERREEERYIANVKEHLEYLRQELRAERISTAELATLQSMAKFIDKGDVELLEAAGVPENEE